MSDSNPQSRRERFEEFEQAAIEAELETGRREETIAEAKRHILIRIGRVMLGTVVVIAGLLMLPLPGPGLLTIAAGLALLASDVPFARKLLERVRVRLPADVELWQRGRCGAMQLALLAKILETQCPSIFTM